VLRLSGRRRRGHADVDAETRFLAYLDSVGVRVSTAVPTRAGSLFCEAAMSEGPRPVVLFRYAEGRPPNLDSVEDARAQGVTLARIHAAAERFPGRQAGRYRLDLDHLLHRQVAAVMESGAPEAGDGVVPVGEVALILVRLPSHVDANEQQGPSTAVIRTHLFEIFDIKSASSKIAC
jgi:Ser/Thr protein kinase RdoA (MazF antagonist)